MTAAARLPPADPDAEASLPSPRAHRAYTPYLLLLPGLLWLALLFATPLVSLISTSLYHPSGSLIDGYRMTGHVDNYVDALAAYAPQFVRSFGYAATATALALLIGYPLAYAIAFKAGRWKHVLLVLVIAPFFTSFLVRTLAWTSILADNGIVVELLRGIGILGAGDRLLATPVAVVMGLTYNFLPFTTLPLYASLERIDTRLLEAATDLYASAFRTFWRVTWPLSMPGVIAGTLLTFIPAAGDFINAALLGTPSSYMIGNVIESQFLLVTNYPTAAALSVTLMATIVILVAGYVRKAGSEKLL